MPHGDMGYQMVPLGRLPQHVWKQWKEKHCEFKKCQEQTLSETKHGWGHWLRSNPIGCSRGNGEAGVLKACEARSGWP